MRRNRNRVQRWRGRRRDHQPTRPRPTPAPSAEFERLTPVQPTERIKLETAPEEISMRVVDLVTPIGKGQRGLIVAPPRTGKTILLKKMAQAVAKNHADMKGLILLVDERPEEVTDFRRSLEGTNFEVVASNNDQPPRNHVEVTERVLHRAKHLVLQKEDVLILFDSLTRMTRAYNTLTPGRSRTLSGGIDASAFQGPRTFFGAARKAEEGGSLTIIGTVLVDTGSRMDQVIFEEFKGTGNMELVLSRDLADQRLYPAIDVMRSGTRREELLLDEEHLMKIHRLRRTLSDRRPADGMQALIAKLEKTATNRAFLAELA